MRVAIAALNDRVSPVFDTAGTLILIDTEAGFLADRQIADIANGHSPTRRVHRLIELGINTLICGAISRTLAVQISAAGIVVIPWLSGRVDDIWQAYLANRLADARWRMPGCRGGPRISQGRRA